MIFNAVLSALQLLKKAHAGGTGEESIHRMTIEQASFPGLTNR